MDLSWLSAVNFNFDFCSFFVLGVIIAGKFLMRWKVRKEEAELEMQT